MNTSDLKGRQVKAFFIRQGGGFNPRIGTITKVNKKTVVVTFDKGFKRTFFKPGRYYGSLDGYGKYFNITAKLIEVK